MSVIDFFQEEVFPEHFRGKRVLEVGSRYVNGSVRPMIQRFLNPSEYIGIDIEPGKYVDLILPAEKIVERFGEESFDTIISTEVLEHVHNWRIVISQMKRALKPGGFLYITTRSKGFPFHSYPYDFWRYEPRDMISIFRDFKIYRLKRDPEAPGVFLIAQKPFKWIPANLEEIELYSMILGRRTRDIPTIDDIPLTRKIIVNTKKKIEETRLLEAALPRAVLWALNRLSS
ncbi:MAG: class I SAM-dependent methyltransferase [Sulfolobales archaeon]